MDPIDALYDEHEAALRELQRLRTAAQRLDEPDALPEMETALRFLEVEIRAHNQWEEDHLFPKLELLLGPSGPCEMMRVEHRLLWDHYARVEPLVDAAKRGTAGADERAQLTRAALSIVDLLEQHIEKENEVLFPMAKRMLRPADFDAMRAARPA